MKYVCDLGAVRREDDADALRQLQVFQCRFRW